LDGRASDVFDVGGGRGQGEGQYGGEESSHVK
jgi:hypothetical protein